MLLSLPRTSAPSSGATPIGLLLALTTTAMAVAGGGSPIGLLLTLTKAA
jgi:hypothetical protein